jgi:hypothetical protein
MNNEQKVKLEFFIGGTRLDLSAASQKLVDTIFEAKHIASGMELWTGGIKPLKADIARHLEQCDVHIIVLGARYGEYIPGGQISFTEWEYEQSAGKRPILAFLLKQSEFDNERKKVILEDPSEREKTDALLKFREKLRQGRICKSFYNTEAGIAELGRKCNNAINELINQGYLGDDTGWVRASSQEVSTLRQISKNKFLERELKRMREFSTVGERVTLDEVSKETQAKIFWETMMGKIRRYNYKNLFFESGSTLSYVSDNFEKYVLKNDIDAESWRVWTNNVFTLLQLMLYTDVDIRRFPPFAPDPEDKYGAIFPHEWHRLRENPPRQPRRLYDAENIAVEEMRKRLLIFDKKTLFLATTSGWDTSNKVLHFQGPHVGSHPNMLFKRAVFSTGCPVVIFLSADKLGDPFEEGVCYPIFDPGLPLENALHNYPLALCVGYDRLMRSPTRRMLNKEVRENRNNPSNIIDILTKLNFNVIYEEIKGDTGAIIAGNSLFKKLLPND